MKKNKKHQEEQKNNTNRDITSMFKKQTIKDLIAPSGIDVSDIDHLEIISNVKRYARSFYVSTLPRMCTFPELFRDMYLFGDINTSIYITPVPEARSQTDLNRVINIIISDFITKTVR